MAHYLAWYFDIEHAALPALRPVHHHRERSPLPLRHRGRLPRRRRPRAEGQQASSAAEFRDKGPLWLALEAPRTMVLIDEIDKAPRDFPDDLLHMLDQLSFGVRETRSGDAPRGGAAHGGHHEQQRAPAAGAVPAAVHLPPIELTRADAGDVAARGADFPAHGEVREAALATFFELRGCER